MKAFLAAMVAMALLTVGANVLLNTAVDQTAGERFSTTDVRLD